LSCAGYFERLQRQVEEQSFDKQVIAEIDEYKTKLQTKLLQLQVKGDFHKAREVKVKLLKLEKATKRIKQLLEG